MTEISAAALAEMRSWIEDCSWSDLPDPSDLTDAQVIAGVKRHYHGGIARFLMDMRS